MPFNEFKDLALVHPGCIHRNTCTFILDDDDDNFKFYQENNYTFFFKGRKYLENIISKNLCTSTIAKQLCFSALTPEEQLFWRLASPGVAVRAHSVVSACPQ